MIKSLTVINYTGNQITIELANPQASGFAVKSIEGLGPAKANITTTEVVTNDGSMYNSARLNERNIVISFLYLDNPTIEDVRQLSYKYFPIKKPITLIVETDNRKAMTKGYVESNEPNIFSKQEGATISIICPDPFFYLYGNDGINVTTFYGVNSLFEFPFEKDSSEEYAIEMGAIQELTEQNIIYDGDSEVGMDIIMSATGEVGDINIYNVTTRAQIKLYSSKIRSFTGRGIDYGDKIVIKTSKGEKGVTLFRDGREINILNCIDRNSDWLTLSKGDNLMAYSTTLGGEYLDFRIENKVIYEGM